MTKNPKPGLNDSYTRYGKLAQVQTDALQLAGRFRIQALAERRIVADVRSKLALEPTHRLLEIGCNMGTLLIPLAFDVAEAWGMDHPNIIQLAKTRFADPRLNWLAGCFPQTQPAGKFDRILVNSVLQYLSNIADIEMFLDQALALLSDGGRLLISDLPNTDRRRRFQTSEAGKAFDIEWKQLSSGPETHADRKQHEIFDGATVIATFNDDQIFALASRCRKGGYHAYIMPQDPRLPFGHTREDLLIVKP
jgi:cyclopropane fatty-acyl-phospholipid synthase-like methyltransferase